MSQAAPGGDPTATPTVEVRVYRDETLLLTELCDTEAEAAETVARWSEVPGLRCEVDDLAPKSPTGEVFEPEFEPVEYLTEDYPAPDIEQ